MQNNDNPIEEKRSSPRFPINAVVLVSDIFTGKVYSGICSNVSAEGLFISTPDDFPLEQLLHLEIHEESDIYVGQGQVVRKIQQDNIFLIGMKIEFTLISD